jgi:RNA-directed DNA polymerase
MDGQSLFPTDAGTPQGGVVSPLLANIALHGLETHITTAYPPERCGIAWKPQVIGYADDFLVLHPDASVIAEVQERVGAWLAEMGLELKPSKTRITHTLSSDHGQPGFDFLGFNVRHYPVGRCHTGKTTRRRPLGFKTIIKPSKDALRRHNQSIAAIVRRHRTAPQVALISRLNPIIRGWSGYYSTVVAKKLFAKLDHEMWCRLRRWALRRHPRKGVRWVVRKYWRRERGRWDFGSVDGPQLRNYAQTPIRRHVKVAGSKSYYDGDWAYWASRLGKHPQVPPWIARTLKRQDGKCAWCGLYLTTEDLYELDHRRPTSQGGRHVWTNWQIIHRHCHHSKTAQDQTDAAEVLTDKGQLIEEPDEPKGSRPVCAVRRSVVSLAQPGRTWRNVLGSNGLPKAERQRRTTACQQSSDPPEGVDGDALLDPHDMVKATLLEAQSPDGECAHPSAQRL